MKKLGLILLALTFFYSWSSAQSITTQEAQEWLDAIFHASAENRVSTQSGSKIPYPQLPKLLSSTEKELKDVMAEIHHHQMLVEARNLALEAEVPLENYFLAIKVFESMGVDNALTSFNYVFGQLMLRDYEVERIFNNNKNWQQQVIGLMGKSYTFTFLDQVILYLTYMDYSPQVRKDALKHIFKGKESKAIAMMSKNAKFFHYTSIEVKKSDRVQTDIQNFISLSEKESSLNQEGYLSYLRRAFGSEQVASWQENTVLPTIDSTEGLIAATLAVMLLYTNPAEQAANYAAIMGGNQRSGDQLLAKQNKIVKLVSGFHKKYK